MDKNMRQLYKIDASGQAVGRIASQIALILRGKNKASYQPQLDQGGIVQVTNINKLKFTGKKLEQKKYYNYSGYPGGLKAKKIIEVKPAEILTKAVKNMLPPIKRRVDLLKRLIIN